MASAAEHRMVGLLRDVAEDLGLAGGARSRLARLDLLQRGRTSHQWTAWREVSDRAADLGVELALLKGVGTEVRWYDRPGQRCSADLDVWLAPGDTDRAGALLRSLDPGHRLVDDIDHLIRSGDHQHVEVHLDGVLVDLHTDVLKLRVPMRDPHGWWDRTVTVTGPDGTDARVLSDECTLVHHLIHLTKDRFRFLGSYVDIARIVHAGGIDWDEVECLADREGLRMHVTKALEAVDDVIPLRDRLPVRSGGWRALVWDRAWRPSVRLRGEEGVHRFRHRQDLIPLTARGRTLESLRTRWRQRLLPPPALVDYYYPDRRGPWLWRLTVGRVAAAIDRLRLRREAA